MRLKLGIFTVFDTAAKQYKPPFNAETPELAKRMFSEIANDPRTEVHKYPHEFALYSVGEFDVMTGEVVSYAPESLGNAAQYLKPEVSE